MKYPKITKFESLAGGEPATLKGGSPSVCLLIPNHHLSFSVSHHPFIVIFYPLVVVLIMPKSSPVKTSTKSAKGEFRRSARFERVLCVFDASYTLYTRFVAFSLRRRRSPLLPAASPTDGEKKQTGYQKFCKVRCVSLVVVPFSSSLRRIARGSSRSFPISKARRLLKRCACILFRCFDSPFAVDGSMVGFRGQPQAWFQACQEGQEGQGCNREGEHQAQGEEE
jgi:hypothetical protein